MAAQIAAAVNVALAPESSQDERKGAYDFLEQVKNSSKETWTECFRLFLAKDEFAPPARLAALQVMDEAIGNGKTQLEPSTLLQIKEGFIEYIQSEFVQGSGEAANFYVRNKVVRTIFLIFLQTYNSGWNDFFLYFIGLTRASPAGASSSTPALNPIASDFTLRLFHEVSVELSDTALRLNKPYSRIAKDGELRDAIRARDAQNIALSIFDILSEGLTAMSSGSGPLAGPVAENLVDLAVQAAGDYVAWIDIGLIITPQSLPLLFGALTSPSVRVRISAADAFIEIVSKGMPSSEKLQLFGVLSLQSVIVQLLDLSDSTRAQAGGAEMNDEREEHFREKLAKLLAAILPELTKICDDSEASDADKASARAAAFEAGALVLRFIGDPVDDISLTVIPPTSSLMTIFKKEKKRERVEHMTPEKQKFLSDLLQTVIQKMQYSPDADWVGAEDDPDIDEDEFKRFDNLRRQLKIIFDAVGWIAEDIFVETCQALLATVLDPIDAAAPGTPVMSWQQVELATYVIYCFGEAAKGTTGTAITPVSFVDLPPDAKGQARKDIGKVDMHAHPLSPLGNVMMRLVQSKLPSFPHHSAPLQFFECCVRYSDFFAVWPETVSSVLQAFLDQRGLYQSHRPAQLRAFYLFHKFLHESRERLRHHMGVDMVQQVMTSLQPLMDVPSDIKLPEGGAVNEATLEAAVDASGGFDKQLYLFESVGTLTLILSNRPEQQVALLSTVLPPLLDNIRASSSPTIASMDDFVRIVRLHNLILALANTAKSLSQNSPKGSVVPSAPWVELYKNAAQTIVESLSQVSTIAVIRNAALSAFKIISSAIGPAILPLIPPFIDTVIQQLTASETIDFLPFIGLLIHRFGVDFEPMLDTILGQVFAKVYSTLQQPVQGTDDELRQSELKRAYFNLILSITGAGYSRVFVSPQNQPQLETVFMSVLHYTNSKESKAIDQKLGVGVLTKFASLWLVPVVPENTPEVAPIPGLERFFYDNVLPICFEIPMRRHFDYGDAHSYAALSEMANFIKTLHQKRGDEFTSDLVNRFFPSIGFPQDKMQDFVMQLSNCSDGKAFKKYFNPMMADLKRALNNANSS